MGPQGRKDAARLNSASTFKPPPARPNLPDAFPGLSGAVGGVVQRLSCSCFGLVG